MINLRSIEGDIYHKDLKVEKDPDMVECDIHYAAIKIVRISENKQKVRMLTNIDPKCDHMPDWLLNNTCKLLAAVFMK